MNLDDENIPDLSGHPKLRQQYALQKCNELRWEMVYLYSTRVDEEGIPKIVQSIRWLRPSGVYIAVFFDDTIAAFAALKQDEDDNEQAFRTIELIAETKWYEEFSPLFITQRSDVVH